MTSKGAEMIRRTLRVTISLAAVSGLLLAGCASETAGGASSDDFAGKTLNVLVSAKAAYPTEQQDWFKHVSDEFEKQTGATVEFETFATAADEQKKIQTSTVSGSGPDIYSVGISFTPVADSTGAFIRLDEAAWDAVGGRDRFVPAALGMAGRTTDTEIAVPFISRPYVLAYNTRMFEEAGIEAPPSSWDEFVDIAEQLTDGDTYGAAIAYADQYDPWKFVWTMSAARGNTIVDGDDVTFDNPVVETAYQTYFGFLTDHGIVNPDSVSWKNAQAVAEFASGKAAMVPMVTSGSYPTLVESSVADEWAYAPMPTVPAGMTELPAGGLDAASTISGDNMVVADYSPNKDLALAFLEFVTSEDEQLHYFEVFGELPANATAAARVAEEHPAYAPVLEAQERSVATPYTGGWSEVQIALGNVVVQSLPGLTQGKVTDASLEALLADAQVATSKAIERAGGR